MLTNIAHEISPALICLFVVSNSLSLLHQPRAAFLDGPSGFIIQLLLHGISPCLHVLYRMRVSRIAWSYTASGLWSHQIYRGWSLCRNRIFLRKFSLSVSSWQEKFCSVASSSYGQKKSRGRRGSGIRMLFRDIFWLTKQPGVHS